jgi:hypothetical protein
MSALGLNKAPKICICLIHFAKVKRVWQFKIISIIQGDQKSLAIKNYFNNTG